MTRDELVNAEVTLDGKRAKICGTRNDFATVRALDGSAAFEWAWPTVERIVAKGGRFRS